MMYYCMVLMFACCVSGPVVDCGLGCRRERVIGNNKRCVHNIEWAVGSGPLLDAAIVSVCQPLVIQRRLHLFNGTLNGVLKASLAWRLQGTGSSIDLSTTC